jgi:hypothetical protein
VLIDLEIEIKVKLPYTISSTTDILDKDKVKLFKIKKIMTKPINRESMINVQKELKYFD